MNTIFFSKKNANELYYLIKYLDGEYDHYRLVINRCSDPFYIHILKKRKNYIKPFGISDMIEELALKLVNEINKFKNIKINILHTGNRGMAFNVETNNKYTKNSEVIITIMMHHALRMLTEYYEEYITEETVKKCKNNMIRLIFYISRRIPDKTFALSKIPFNPMVFYLLDDIKLVNKISEGNERLMIKQTEILSRLLSEHLNLKKTRDKPFVYLSGRYIAVQYDSNIAGRYYIVNDSFVSTSIVDSNMEYGFKLEDIRPSIIKIDEIISEIDNELYTKYFT